MGGLAEAVGGLAASQVGSGFDVSVFLPLYRSVREHADLEPVGTPFEIDLGDTIETGRLWRVSAPASGPRVFLVEHAGFFDRAGIYGEDGTGYADNDRRFAFFTKAALEKLPDVVVGPTVVHAHDWHTALAPFLVRSRSLDPFYRGVATVLTVHNAAFQGVFPLGTTHAMLGTAVADPNLSSMLSWFGEANWLKAGIMSAGVVTTVSPTHAKELTTPEGGFGLHETFRSLGGRLVGILNGIDSTSWNPATDRAIPATYHASDLRGKRLCRSALLESYRLDRTSTDPVVVMSARLVAQKGIDLVLAVIPRLLDHMQFVILGRGEVGYLHALKQLERAAPTRVAVPGDFSDTLERQALAGADILLLPSLYEPCGLTQMRAQRYGSLPIVRSVGGLIDTVVDGLSGFQFQGYNADDLSGGFRRALGAYHRQPDWTARMVHAMQRDFDWNRSTPEYTRLYRRLIPRAGRPVRSSRALLAATTA